MTTSCSPTFYLLSKTADCFIIKPTEDLDIKEAKIFGSILTNSCLFLVGIVETFALTILLACSVLLSDKIYLCLENRCKLAANSTFYAAQHIFKIPFEKPVILPQPKKEPSFLYQAAVFFHNEVNRAIRFSTPYFYDMLDTIEENPKKIAFLVGAISLYFLKVQRFIYTAIESPLAKASWKVLEQKFHAEVYRVGNLLNKGYYFWNQSIEWLAEIKRSPLVTHMINFDFPSEYFINISSIKKA